MKKSNLTVALYLLLVFISGILVGAFGHRLYATRSVSAGPGPGPDEYRRRYMGEMKKRLGLDDRQVKEVGIVLDETRDRFKAVRTRVQPEMEAIHKQQVERIRDVLNDSQKAEYARMLEERERERERERHGPRK